MANSDGRRFNSSHRDEAILIVVSTPCSVKKQIPNCVNITKFLEL